MGVLLQKLSTWERLLRLLNQHSSAASQLLQTNEVTTETQLFKNHLTKPLPKVIPLILRCRQWQVTRTYSNTKGTGVSGTFARCKSVSGEKREGGQQWFALLSDEVSLSLSLSPPLSLSLPLSILSLSPLSLSLSLYPLSPETESWIRCPWWVMHFGDFRGNISPSADLHSAAIAAYAAAVPKSFTRRFGKNMQRFGRRLFHLSHLIHIVADIL